MSENSELFEEFSTYLKANFKNLSILKFKDILVKKEIEPIILLTTSGRITKTRLNLLLEEIKLLDLDIKGHIYLDPNLKYKDL